MSINKPIYYLARILSVLIVVFFAVFILEGLSPEFGVMDSLSHLIPTLVVLLISAIAWKWAKIGGWLFILFGIYCLLFFKMDLSSAVIGGVPVITGILFLLEGKFSGK
ncbi:MAG: hypothetical protein WC470_00995 [Candidatus Paceibacterota bacterium]